MIRLKWDSEPPPNHFGFLIAEYYLPSESEYLPSPPYLPIGFCHAVDAVDTATSFFGVHHPPWPVRIAFWCAPPNHPFVVYYLEWEL